MKNPVKHFDLPKYHLIGDHHVPSRARQSDEIERRHTLRPGTLVLEQQRDGLAIARHMLEQVEDRPDIEYLSTVLAACAFNSSWYAFAREAPGMRRRLEMPQLVSTTHDTRTTTTGMLDQVRNNMAAAVETAGAYTVAYDGGYNTHRQSMRLGQEMGNVALGLATIPVTAATYGLSPVDTQLAVRERGLETLDNARQLISVLGVNASAAQLADPDTALSVHIRQTATDNVYYAFEQAREELPRVA